MSKYHVSPTFVEVVRGTTLQIKGFNFSNRDESYENLRQISEKRF